MTEQGMRVIGLVFVVTLAAGACGRALTDNYVDPCAGENVPVPCPWVHVTPAAVTISQGQTVQFTASWDAKFGPVTWRWTSSDSARVSVDSTGLARAIDPIPGVAICATASTSRYPNAKGCAQVVTPAR